MSFSVVNNNLLVRCLQNLRLDLRGVSCNYSKKHVPVPRFRPPHWYAKKDRTRSEDLITKDNRDFISEVVGDRFGSVQRLTQASPLAGVEAPEPAPWSPGTKRCGLVARKIGVYPMWLKNGKRVLTTLLQVVDNYVVRYIPPEEFKPMKPNPSQWREKNTEGALVVGAGTVDPASVTKQYSNLFLEAGLQPTKRLCRFRVSPHAALPPGTPLTVAHFQVGHVVDIRAKTISRGFQGVMKRWGFKGMPASHGVTKTHRRPGNIGGGGEKGRVWPGKKMPGHMGNKMRVHRGVKILRINYKHNVMWCTGVGIPGGANELCYVMDTLLPLRRLREPPPFPTHLPAPGDAPLEEAYDESVHQFHHPTITYPDE